MRISAAANGTNATAASTLLPLSPLRAGESFQMVLASASAQDGQGGESTAAAMASALGHAAAVIENSAAGSSGDAPTTDRTPVVSGTKDAKDSRDSNTLVTDAVARHASDAENSAGDVTDTTGAATDQESVGAGHPTSAPDDASVAAQQTDESSSEVTKGVGEFDAVSVAPAEGAHVVDRVKSEFAEFLVAPAAIESSTSSAGASATATATTAAMSAGARPAAKQDRSNAQRQTAAAAMVSVAVPVETRDVVVSVFRGDDLARKQSNEAAVIPAKQSNDTTAKQPETAKGAVDSSAQSKAVDTSVASELANGSGSSVVPTQVETFDSGLVAKPATGDVSGVQAVIPSGLIAPTTDSLPMKFPGVAKLADATSGSQSVTKESGDSASRAVATGAQGQANAQNDISKAVASTVRSTDAPVAVASAGAPHITGHEGTIAQRLSSDAPDTPRAASPHVAADEDAAASGINAAKLMQTMGETEMHVGMHSAEFGDISIRTAVSQQQMVAQISLDHGDLSQAITNHVSSVQAKLGEEYGLRASIQVNSQGASFTGDRGGSSQGDGYSNGRSARRMALNPVALTESGVNTALITGSAEGRGLDVRV